MTMPVDVLAQPRPPLAGVVVTASSAGGLGALTILLRDIPATFPAAIIIVQHIDPSQPSLMAPLLARRTKLHVVVASEGDALEPGTVYVAPPNHHVTVNPDFTISLNIHDRVQYVRPSANVLFASVASVFGARAVAVVLTGTGRDGADGVTAIKRCKGYVIAQDDESSTFGGMPQAARDTGNVDEVLPLEDIAAALGTWAEGKTR